MTTTCRYRLLSCIWIMDMDPLQGKIWILCKEIARKDLARIVSRARHVVANWANGLDDNKLAKRHRLPPHPNQTSNMVSPKIDCPQNRKPTPSASPSLPPTHRCLAPAFLTTCRRFYIFLSTCDRDLTKEMSSSKECYPGWFELFQLVPSHCFIRR